MKNIILAFSVALSIGSLSVAAYSLKEVKQQQQIPPYGLCVDRDGNTLVDLYVRDIRTPELNNGILTCMSGNYEPVTPATDVKHGA